MPHEAVYPPEQHVTRDLAPRLVHDGTGATLLQPIAPELLDAQGCVRFGVVAMGADIIAGDAALRAVTPDWIATSSLSLQLAHLPRGGTLRIGSTLLRKGRTTAVLELALDVAEDATPVGRGTATFAVLPTRTDFQRQTHWIDDPDPNVSFGGEAPSFGKPLLEALGVRFDPNDPSVARIDMSDYVVNSLGAMQGGVVAMLVDAAADHFAQSLLARPVRLAQVEIHYLKLGKIGPIRAQARDAGALGGGGRLLRVELRDEGQDDALLTVASVLADPTQD